MKQAYPGKRVDELFDNLLDLNPIRLNDFLVRGFRDEPHELAETISLMVSYLRAEEEDILALA